MRLVQSRRATVSVVLSAQARATLCLDCDTDQVVEAAAMLVLACGKPWSN
jgi:hypothetical protein